MNDMPKIEKNIAIPQQTKWGKNVEFLKKLDVGDSFVIEKESIRGSFGVSARRLGIKLTTRKLEDGKIRLWRIK